MANETIYVVDEIVTRPGEGRAFLDAYMKRYAPGAQTRGLRLDRVLISPPLWLDAESNTIIITWTLQGTPAWWQMSFRSRTEPSVTSWWADVDEKVVSRKRSYMSAAADIEALTNV